MKDLTVKLFFLEEKGETVEYNVSVPPNSMATLYLKGKKMKENGRTIEENPWIRIKETQKDQIILELKSGNYRFEIR